MFSFLNRFNIIQISIASLVLFITLVVVLSSYSIDKTFSRYQAAQQDIELVDLVAALEQVAHHHAVERGLTAGYLGAPTPTKKQNLDAQRDKADNSVNVLREYLSHDWPESLQLSRHVLPLRNHLDQKNSTRQQVNREQAPGAFAYYSTLNRLALDLAEIVASNIAEKEVRDASKTILLFAQYKERAGQVRGMINGTLARQSVTPQFQTQLKNFSDDIGIISTYINNALSDAQRGEFSGIVNGRTNQTIKQVSQTLATNLSPNFSTLPAPAQWFPTATTHIGEVKGILDSQVEYSKSLAADVASGAYNLLIALVVGIIVFIAIILLLNAYLVINLRNSLGELTEVLERVAKNGDLTIDVRLKSDDELGFISKAIHTTIYAFKDLVTGLATSIEANKRLNIEMEGASEEVQNSVHATEGLATNIASSITQMSATSDEIARSATTTLEACNGLNESVVATSKTNLATREAMQKLASEMQVVESKASEMETQLNAIGGMLETINNVAEQTNLLALNAAIEAARAGEQGRGFAVVADEVRSLAQGSQQSSDNISKLLNDLESVSGAMIESIRTNVSSANDTLSATMEAEDIAQKLKEQADQVESMTTSVSVSSEQQSAVAKQIAEDAVSVLDSAQTEVEAVTRMKQISNDLDANAKVLERTMKGFKIK